MQIKQVNPLALIFIQPNATQCNQSQPDKNLKQPDTTHCSYNPIDVVFSGHPETARSSETTGSSKTTGTSETTRNTETAGSSTTTRSPATTGSPATAGTAGAAGTASAGKNGFELDLRKDTEYLLV